MVKLPNKTNLKLLLYWMEERQRIFLKKRQGDPWPWTNDPILRRFKFCNVYREQDRVTQWIRHNWREPFADHKNLWFAMAVARQINWPPTLEAIGFPQRWQPGKVLSVLRKRAVMKVQNYSGAYMLTAGGANRGVDKPNITVEKILTPLFQDVKRNPPPWETSNSCQLKSAWEWFLPHYGFGPFLAYEIITDLRHTRYLRYAPDIHTWANVGPGARRGLNRLYKRPTKQMPKQEQLLSELQQIALWITNNRNPAVLPNLELRDVEHSLCEWDKYTRAKESFGRIGLDLYRREGRSGEHLF